MLKLIPWPIYVWPCKSLHLVELGQNHPIVRFIYQCHMIGEEFVFLSCLQIKHFELCVELEFAFYNGTALAYFMMMMIAAIT